jgi:hypothetical protein
MDKTEIVARHSTGWSHGKAATPTGRSASEGVGGSPAGGMGELSPTPTPTDPHPTPTAAPIVCDESADHREEAEPMVPPHEALRLADAALDASRFEHRQAKQVLDGARQQVGLALAAYNAAAPHISPEQNVRDWISSNQARKAALAETGRIPFRPSVTETAKAMSGGGHGDDIRTRRGGGAAYRRGPEGVQAFTKTQAMTITAQRLREAAKLPSER